MSRPTRLAVHFGNEEHNTGHHLVAAFRQHHVDVITVGRGHPSTAPLPAGAPLVWVESGVASFPTIDDLAHRPTAAWIIDTHRGYEWRAPLGRAFDLCYVAQQPAVQVLAAHGVHAHWLPLASFGHSPGFATGARTVSASFVGHVRAGTRRAQILQGLDGIVTRNTEYMSPPEMLELYERSVIVVNIPLATDLNMRLFEAAGAGAYVVTGPMDGLEQVLPAGSYEVIASDDPHAWAARIEQAVTDTATAARAARAETAVHERHLYFNRAGAILDAFSGLERGTIDTGLRRSALLTAAIRCHAGADAWRISDPTPRGRAAVTMRLGREAFSALLGRAARTLRRGAPS